MTQRLDDRFPATMTSQQVAEALDLQPVTGRADIPVPYAERLAQTDTGWQRIMLFDSDGFYAWQRQAQAQSWHWLAGAPVVLTASPDGHDAEALHLGPNAALRQQESTSFDPQIWQTATTLGAWSLVRCDMADAPVAANIDMAPADWFPTPRAPRTGPA